MEKKRGDALSAAGSPDKLGFGMDVSDAILGQTLVDAVKKSPQKPPHHAHEHEESQVDSCPQVAVLISIWTLTMSKEQFSSIKESHGSQDF